MEFHGAKDSLRYTCLNMIPPLLSRWHANLTRKHPEHSDKRFSVPHPVFGHARSLVHVKPRPDLLYALVNCWQSEASVFKFGYCEMAPTLEEVSNFFCLQFRNRDLLYPQSDSLHMLQSVCKLKKSVKSGEFDKGICSPQFLFDRFGADEGFINFHEEIGGDESSWQHRREDMFYICLFSLLIFPRKDGMIQLPLGKCLANLSKAPLGKTFTIVPMILAEIFRTLTLCNDGKSDYFTACNLFLECWAIEHMCIRNIRSAGEAFLMDLFRSHEDRVKGFKVGSKWGDHLDSRGFKDVQWLLPDLCILKAPIIYGSNDQPLILLGLTGTAPYEPRRIMRQFGLKQDIPPPKDPCWDSYWTYFDKKQGSEFEIALGSWKRKTTYPDYKFRRVSFSAGSTLSYRTWLSNQLTEVIPIALTIQEEIPERVHSLKRDRNEQQSESDTLKHKVARLEAELVASCEREAFLRERLYDMSQRYSNLSYRGQGIYERAIQLKAQAGVVDLVSFYAQLVQECTTLKDTVQTDNSEESKETLTKTFHIFQQLKK